MRLTAIDCLRRGCASLAANWELVPLQWLQSLVTGGLILLGLLVPVMAIGFNLWAHSWLTVEGAEEGLGELLLLLSELTPALVFSLLAMLVLWTLAFVLYCYLQAGTYGILMEGDRRAAAWQAPRQAFRAYSLDAFKSWGSRYFWRFFWFLNLFGVFGSLVLLAATLGLVLALLSGERWGAPAAISLSCGGALLTIAAFVALSIWFVVAQADLAQEGSGVWEASRRGLGVLGRRPGAVLLLLLIFVAASLALTLFFAPVGFVLDLMTWDDPVLRGAAQMFLALVQMLPNALLAVALGGALVALVRSETQSEPEVLAA